MNRGLHTRMHKASFDTPAGKEKYFSQMTQELNLTPTQREQMESVLNDCWTYYRTVLTDSRSRVEQILNEEQRHKFDRFLQSSQPQ